MNGFWHYFLSLLDPMSNLGFSRAIPELMSSWAAFLFLPVIATALPATVIWIVYLVKPALIRPPLPSSPGHVEPLVSVVIAGRNELATIGESIRGALTCGYANLEVIFVDDNSSDDSVAIARRAALSVTRSSRDAERVRIFPSPRRNGKASSLDIGIRMARGEFIAIIDADSIIQFGSMQHWLLPFNDPRVGAVCANIRVNNSTVNLITRFQEIEYALKFTLSRFVQARLNLLNIITGMGGLFRGEFLRRLGGYDTGLGDDTDLTVMLRKQRWRLEFSLDAIVWTTVPDTREHLWRQRERWRRNLIKIRISKHRDLFVLGRYGFANAMLAIQVLLLRILAPVTLLTGLIWLTYEDGPLAVPELIATVYWILIVLTLIRLLVTREISSTPKAAIFPLIFVFYPSYMLWLNFVLLYAESAELLRIGAKHPYVPDHVWEEIPWW